MRPVGERVGTTAMFLANGLGIGAWAVEVPRIKDELALSDSALGLALFAFALGAIVAMPLAGRLSARIGSARATASTGLAFVALLPLPALVSGFPSLCVALLLLGAANGAMDVSMNGHASAIEAAWKAPIMSSFHAAWSAGGLLGSGGGALLQRAGVGVTGGLALPDLLIAALVIASVVRGRVPRTFAAAAAAGAPSSPGEPASAFALPSAAVMKLAALAFLCMLLEGAVADWSAVYLNATLATAAGTAALGYSSFAFAMAGCRVLGDGLAGRFGARRVVALGGATAAAGIGLVLSWPTLAAACVGFALVGIGVANVVPLIFSAAGRLTASPAVGVSMAATAGYAGFLVGPPLIGFMAGVIGLRSSLGLLVIAALVVASLGARAVDRAPPDARP